MSTRRRAGSKAASAFADMLNRSHTRNRDLIGRINAKITRFQLDYDRDVLPLTPRGNATERHIIAAFQAKALDALGGAAQAAAYWADAFSIDPAEVNAKIANTNAFAEFLRSKLIKRGGLGYQQPTAQTFPLLGRCHRRHPRMPRHPDVRLAGWRFPSRTKTGAVLADAHR
ncbi:MAG: hypothetical protein ACOX6W_17635 [Lentisphaeria bacterium]